jgi:hypothetical protein
MNNSRGAEYPGKKPGRESSKHPKEIILMESQQATSPGIQHQNLCTIV